MSADDRAINPVWSCPLPAVDNERIQLGHGAGGRLSQRLLDELILPAFANPYLALRDDQAVLPAQGGRIAFTTDSYVVTPLFFPGGDIGCLAVYGTVNDLAMAGARPRFLSLSFILEEGLPLDVLRAVVRSIDAAARRCGVQIVTGDTKVVGRGSADQLFINTSGIGVVPDGVELSAQHTRPGDVVLISGTLADHGMAIMAARDGLGIEGGLASDCAPLYELVHALLQSGAQLRCLRDPTRGGLAAALTELANRAGVGMDLDESALPVRDAVRGACELLGLDPMFVANEGKLVAIVAAEDAQRALQALRDHPLGRDAAIIGRTTETAGELTIRTSIGGQRLLELPLSTPLPRIC